MSTHRLSVAVMTHPSRADRATALARDLADGGTGVDVVTDPEPDGPPAAFRATLAAWSATPHWATHRLVLHDDMLPAAGFLVQARHAVAAFPTAALALFSFWNSRNGAAARLGALAGHRWVRAMHEYLPCTALVLPIDLASGYVRFARQAGDAWAEDVLMYRYLRSAGRAAYVATPSLAEHEGMLTSLSGNDFQGVRRSSWFLADPGSLPAGQPELVPDLTVVPFFKRGVARCAVRIPDASGDRWEDVPVMRFLARRGHAAADVQRALAGHLAATGRADDSIGEAVGGTWTTAYAMGVVCARDSVLCGQVDARLRDGDGTLAGVMATIAPGGMCDRLQATDLSDRLPDLSAVAAAGFRAGFRGGQARTAGPPGPGSRVRNRAVVVRGGDFPVHSVARGLADRWYRVVVAGAHPDGGRHPDLEYAEELPGRASLRPDGVVTVGSPSAGPAVDLDRGPDRLVRVEVARDGAGAAAGTATMLRAAGLYGPGMPMTDCTVRLVLRALMSQPIDVGAEAARPVHLLHVDDLVAAVDDVLSGRVRPGAVSFVPGAELTLGDLVHVVRRVVRPVPVRQAAPQRFDRVEDRPPALPGWRPRVGVDQGIHELAQWLAYQADSPLRAAPDAVPSWGG